jgi:thymidine phosphorylase
VRTDALITRMGAPLGRMVGNSLEVIEALETLKGRGPRDVEELSVLLAARMLVLSAVAGDETEAVARVRAALGSGAGLEKFREVVARQGGDPRALDDYDRLPSAPDRLTVAAPRAGYVAGLDAEAVGRAAVALGAGRARLDDPVDPGVGIEIVAPVGARLAEGDPVLIVHHGQQRGLDAALPLLRGAIHLADEAPPAEPLVIERILHG